MLIWPLNLGLAAFAITLGIRLALHADHLLSIATAKLKPQPIPPMIGAYLWPLFWFCLFVLAPTVTLTTSLGGLIIYGPHWWELIASAIAISVAAFGWWKIRR